MDNEIEIPEQAISRFDASADDIYIDSSEENLRLSLELVEQAARSVDIYTQDLNPRIYDTVEFSIALRDFVVHNQRASVRILVAEPNRMIKNGHRIIELSRRLTSSLELRQVPRDYHSDPQTFLLADGRGVIQRKDDSRFEAVANYNNPSLGRELQGYFNTVWEHSTLIADLRRLHI